MVGAVKDKHPLEVLGSKVELDLIFADGMMGCCPVFDNQKDAFKYSDNTYPVFAITLYDPKGE